MNLGITILKLKITGSLNSSNTKSPLFFLQNGNIFLVMVHAPVVRSTYFFCLCVCRPEIDFLERHLFIVSTVHFVKKNRLNMFHVKTLTISLPVLLRKKNPLISLTQKGKFFFNGIYIIG